MRVFVCKLSFLVSLFFISQIWSHGGGLNEEGCHNERKTGDYHCHRSPSINPSFSQPERSSFSEKDIVRVWCKAREGQNEYRTKYGTFVDCLTSDYAVEVEYDTNWKEAIGQSLHYAEATGKMPAILLIKKKKSKKDYLFELNRVIVQYELPIRVFEIGE